MRPGKNASKLCKFTIISGAFIFIVSLLIKISTFYPMWIEEHYSQGFYLVIANFLRIVFGWISFSIGDILYFVAGCFLLVKFIKFVKLLIRRQYTQEKFKKSLKKGFFVLATIYIIFNISWGLNYNRPGIAYQLGLQPQLHNLNDLKLITQILIKKVNENRLLLGKEEIKTKPYQQIFTEAQDAYKSTAGNFPFLSYDNGSIKRSMYGRVGSFLGFLGYYNPFTGEAQLNLTQPRFLIPYVACHEMAHQLGYASESEANFVGYLAAVRSPDTVFHYSVYFDLFNYANRELYIRDSVAAKENFKKLDTLVKADVAEVAQYWSKSENIVEPIIKVFYDHYLKANQQTLGVKSYNEVVGWLIAYYKKYGSI